MKIKELIQIFNKLIPLYKRAIDNEWDYNDLSIHNLFDGICLAAEHNLHVDLEEVMNGYYKNYLTYNEIYLFEPVRNWNNDNINLGALQSRLKFMQSEIVELNKLMRKGYTHV